MSQMFYRTGIAGMNQHGHTLADARAQNNVNPDPKGYQILRATQIKPGVFVDTSGRRTFPEGSDLITKCNS